MRRRQRHDDTELALTNFSLTLLKAILAMCVVMILMISPETKKEDGIKPKIEFMISMEWPGKLDYDVDIWIKDPDGIVIYYGNREGGFVSLERDDMGFVSTTTKVNGVDVQSPYHEELVAIRGIKPGEYIINVHLYRALTTMSPDSVTPFPVKVKIEKLNPTVRRVFDGTVTFNRVRDELHVTRFTMDRDGEVSNFTNDLPIMIREKIR